jgi:hypothetical protein
MRSLGKEVILGRRDENARMSALTSLSVDTMIAYLSSIRFGTAQFHLERIPRYLICSHAMSDALSSPIWLPSPFSQMADTDRFQEAASTVYPHP